MHLKHMPDTFIFAGKWFIIMFVLPFVMFYAQNLALMKDRLLVYVLLFYGSSYEVNILMRALSVYCQPRRTVNFIFAHSFNSIIICNLLSGLECPHRLFFPLHFVLCLFAQGERPYYYCLSATKEQCTQTTKKTSQLASHRAKKMRHHRFDLVMESSKQS